MARMTSADMMKGAGGPCNPITGVHMPVAPTGRTGPLPPGSGSRDFFMDMDGDQDGDVHATDTGAKDMGTAGSDSASIKLEAMKSEARQTGRVSASHFGSNDAPEKGY